jgi:diguanylate cyclase (GGDEF)-like protein
MIDSLVAVAALGLALVCSTGYARAWVRHRRDHAQWAAQLRAAVAQAHTDVLTSLPNRAALTAELDYRAHSGRGWSLVLVDVDHFKTINDTFGHAAGDQVLTTIARRLRDGVGEHALVARLGGDEFAIIMSCPPQRAVALMERLARAVEWSQPVHGLALRVSVSAGVAGFEAELTLPELMRRADVALYRAKEIRGRAVAWTPDAAVPASGWPCIARSADTAACWRPCQPTSRHLQFDSVVGPAGCPPRCPADARTAHRGQRMRA